MNEHVDYKSKNPSLITKGLWWCAGADADILKYSSYSDHVKYSGIGGVVLATAFLAALSMGFAIHTIFEGNWYITVPIAISWSLIVFNLDRFIVSSTGKGDGESSISLKELMNAMPRILMATLLGLTISAPLETVIFDTEIMRTWEETKGPRAQSKRLEREQFYRNDIERIKEQLKDDQKRYDDALKEYNEAIKRVQDEIQTGAGGMKGDGPEAKKLQQLAKEIEKELLVSRIKLDATRKSEDSINTVLRKDIESNENKIKNEKLGFLDKLLMLEKLSSQEKVIDKYNARTNTYVQDPNNKNENIKEVVWGAAFWPIWLVRLLFMIVEVAPVLLKLMLIKGPYDYMTENVHQILETKQGISIFHMIDEHSQLHKLKRNHNPERIIGIIEHQNIKQEENSKIAIDQLAEVEKRKIIENPDDFFEKNT